MKIPQILLDATYIYSKPEGFYTVGIFEDETKQWSDTLQTVTPEHIATLVLLYTRSEELYNTKKENDRLDKLVRGKHLTLIDHMKIWYKTKRNKNV